VSVLTETLAFSPVAFLVCCTAAPCNARATSCSQDSDCPTGHYCGDCSELGLWSQQGNMCRPCRSHPDGGVCPDCDAFSYGDYPCTACSGIPGCNLTTCTNSSDEQCSKCLEGYYQESLTTCKPCANGGPAYTCGTCIHVCGAFV
jgi:hypothetical protein